MFAVLLKMKDSELSQKYRPDHLAFLEKHHQDNNVTAYGKFTDGAGGLIIYRAETLEQAEDLVKEDPYIKTGARTYEIHEWAMVSEQWS
nr:YciI family protein [Bacillus piscicola]